MLQISKMNMKAEELTKYKIGITALQGIIWKGSGSVNEQNNSLYYRGNEDRQGHQGVGFIVAKNYCRSVIDFVPISPRMCKIRIKGQLNNITFINVYAPTENADESEAIRFYEQLQEKCEETSAHDALIVLGDLNAQLGKEEIHQEVGGINTIHEVANGNGMRVKQFAAANNLIQVDHILISIR